MNLKLQTVSSDNNVWMCKMSAFVYIVAEYSARGNKRNAQSVETHRMYYLLARARVKMMKKIG